MPTAFTHPTRLQLAGMLAGLAPWRRLIAPHFEGLERIPGERPLLFVGNHTIFGVLDVPFLFAELWEQKGIFLRSLGDHAHFKIPVWGDWLRRLGVVDGTRENCAALMRAGEPILVFPGGAREVAKRKHEKYQLIWKERLGFARMAARHACTIVPFAAVGAEDAFDIIADANDFGRTPLGKLLGRLGVRDDFVLPLARGIGPTPLPRPERFYFWFGEPIATAPLHGREGDDCAMRGLRDRVRTAVQGGIAHLIALRAVDPRRSLRARLRPRPRPRPAR